jgi:translation initiation factor 4G
MMTSALLNMLDTPEEASTESFSDEDNNRYRLQEPCEEQRPLYGDPLDVESSMFERLSLNGVKHNYQIRSVSDTNTSDSWSPTWQGSLRGPASPPASSLDGNAQALSAIPPRHSQGHNTPPSSDIGLFIP